jgi:phosphoribosylamine--glycine ligase
MRVLVIGGGGREHALCWALDRSESVSAVDCAPGNAGIAEVARCHPAVDPVDRDAVVDLARSTDADLVVVGPEAPLVAGVADAVRAAGVRVFGPSSGASRIEGSKQFAKDVMTAAGVATARYWSGDDPDLAVAALDDFAPPYVVKADGLAAGKGVRICEDRDSAVAAIEETMIAGLFGDAGNVVVIEEFLAGPEVSVFALCDGADCRLLAPAQDFKRAFDGDEGPNTGGMGAWCPYPLDDRPWTSGAGVQRPFRRSGDTSRAPADAQRPRRAAACMRRRFLGRGSRHPVGRTGVRHRRAGFGRLSRRLRDRRTHPWTGAGARGRRDGVPCGHGA